MMRYQPNTGKTTMLAAAAAATLALAGFVDTLFEPAQTSFGAKVEAAYARTPHVGTPRVEVAIEPARVEVVGVRPAHAEASQAHSPRV